MLNLPVTIMTLQTVGRCPRPPYVENAHVSAIYEATSVNFTVTCFKGYKMNSGVSSEVFKVNCPATEFVYLPQIYGCVSTAV